MHTLAAPMHADSSAAARIDSSPANRIARLAQQNLRDSAYFVLRNVKCEFKDGVLTLRGSLPSWHMKQMAQALVVRLDSIDRVDNRIVVQSYC